MVRGIAKTILLVLLVAPACVSQGPSVVEPERSAIAPDAIRETVRKLTEIHGEPHAARIVRGVEQAARLWWPEDGDSGEFTGFCVDNFIADDAKLNAAFDRMELLFEQMGGHLHEFRRDITTPLDLDTGPIEPVDRLFAEVDLAAHVDDELYGSKVAFLALLNFPVHSLTDRLRDGDSWDRRTWARSRLMDGFASRVPADISREITLAFTDADQYVAAYNIRMDRLVAADGERPFPEGLRLITHWGLRDELKSQYGDADGLDRQRMIHDVMRHIVRQTIPERVIDNADLLWAPGTNEVQLADGQPAPDGADAREPDTRYAKLLGLFHAVRRADPYSPTAPTFIDRRFQDDRQIPEEEVEALLVSVLESDGFRDTAERIRGRLGRPLEPFDIWYNGFTSRSAHPEEKLDRAVSRRYPDVAAFQDGLPRLLTGLGFTPGKAEWLAQHIVVDPSRGAGHAMGAVRREDQAHLRTRVLPGGMDYKGYNIAVHELGHNVEQVFSLNAIDHWSMNGVPNNGFTEAMAFLFQERDLELLGLSGAGDDAHRMAVLNTLWDTAEIGGVALVDMKVWRWMYDHPEASPAELREATLSIARDVWNRYFAPVFGSTDEEILAVYSHMIVYGLYLPDYPLGHIIAFQLAAKMRDADFGAEFERMARQGRLTPDAWMRGATGEPLSTRALLDAARRALDAAH